MQSFRPKQKINLSQGGKICGIVSLAPLAIKCSFQTNIAQLIRDWGKESKKLRERCRKKKLKKKLTNVSFAFTHTYTPVKTNIFRFFPQAYMENFEKCAKTQKQKTICCPMLPKYGRYTGDFPQMPVNTGAPLFIRATWPHWEGGVGANSPL